MNTRVSGRLYFPIVVAVAVLFSGCSLTDLRPTDLKRSGPSGSASVHGRALLEQSLAARQIPEEWDRAGEWSVTARDVWFNNWIRRLTPIEQPDQRVQFGFSLTEDAALMRYLEGRRQGQSIVIDNGQTFRVINGVKRGKQERAILQYLWPVRNYFFWPQTLAEAPVVQYLGLKNVGDRMYDRIFVTYGSFVPDRQHDQFIVWLDRETRRVGWIEFTLRDLLPAYRGAVAYRHYTPINGMWMPFTLQLADEVGDRRFSHILHVETMTFSRPVAPRQTGTVNGRDHAADL